MDVSNNKKSGCYAYGIAAINLIIGLGILYASVLNIKNAKYVSAMGGLVVGIMSMCVCYMLIINARRCKKSKE
jgi:predicted butyrate kinase (DUF1464 family)